VKRWSDLELGLRVRRVHPLEHRFDVVDLVVEITCALSRGLALDVRITLLLRVIERLPRIFIVVVTWRLLRLRPLAMKRHWILIMRLAHLLADVWLGLICLAQSLLLLVVK